MKAKLSTLLSSVLLAASATAAENLKPGVSLDWAPALFSALSHISDGRAGDIVRNIDDRQMAALNLTQEDIALLAKNGVADARGLDAALQGPRGSVFAGSKTVTPVRLRDLSRSLGVLAPVVARLEGAAVTPETLGKSPSDLAQALEAQAKESGALADLVLKACSSQGADPARTVRNYRDLQNLLDFHYPFLQDAAMDKLLKAASPLLEKAEQAEHSLAQADGQADRL